MKKTNIVLFLNIYRIIRMCCLYLVISMCCSCSITDIGHIMKNDNIVERSIFAMDTYMNIRAYGKQAKTAVSLACDKIEELEQLFSVTEEGSDIFRVNQADGKKTEISKDTANIINKAIQIGEETNGALDITLYPVLKEWGFTTEEYQIPEKERLQLLLNNVDYRQIQLQETQISIPKEAEIDLGALAKGYTSDQIIEIFKENGIESALINLGGNVHTIGTKPDGSLWKIGVRDPFESSGEICILSITDCAVITSGTYERYFIGADGKRYWHILNPTDGQPAENGLVSVTIIGKEGLRCDALSTALFVSGLDNAIMYWRDYQDFEMILVTEDKRIYITEGIEENIRNVSKMDMEIINK